MSYTRIKMTQFAVPQAATFNLLGDKNSIAEELPKQENNAMPTSHLRSKITFTMMTDDIELPLDDIPAEFLDGIKYENC